MDTTTSTAPIYYRLSTGGGMAPLAPHRDHFGRRTVDELRAWAAEHSVLPAMERAIEAGGGNGDRGTFDVGIAAGRPMLTWQIEPWAPEMDPYHRVTSAPQWQHVDTLRAASMATVPRRDIEHMQSLLRDLDGQIRADLTAPQEQSLERLWDALHAMVGVAPTPRSTAPVIAFLRREPFDGPALTATIRPDDAERAGYTIPELIVGSDGVRESGPPHFARYADALTWARAAGWRVWTERVTDPMRGDASEPHPSEAS
jgi:hypothetical protein